MNLNRLLTPLYYVLGAITVGLIWVGPKIVRLIGAAIIASIISLLIGGTDAFAIAVLLCPVIFVFLSAGAKDPTMQQYLEAAEPTPVVDSICAEIERQAAEHGLTPQAYIELLNRKYTKVKAADFFAAGGKL